MSTAMKKQFAIAKKIQHPNSRKSLAIAKKAKKISNREKAKLGGVIKQNVIGEKMLWIQQNMVDICPYTPEMTAELLEQYIERNDEEIGQIDIKRSVGGKRGRQHASREDVLRMAKERELEEYKTCGIEIPDILTASQCDMLRKWNGELKCIPNFKFRRFGLKHVKDAQQKENKLAMKAEKKMLVSHSDEASELSNVTRKKDSMHSEPALPNNKTIETTELESAEVTESRCQDAAAEPVKVSEFTDAPEDNVIQERATVAAPMNENKMDID